MRAALDAADADAAARAEGGALDGGDAASEAPSVISGFSIYTDATTAAPGGGGGTPSSAGGSSAAAPSAPPSTLGGRRAWSKKRSGRRAARALQKVKAGSPQEEAALRLHLAGLGPQGHSLEEAGQLGELLCMLGHLDDAQKLQRALAAWQAAHAEASGEAAAMAAADAAAGAALPGAGGGGAGGAAQQPGGGQQQQQQQQQQPGVTWKWDVLRAA
jgi:hypothetical protein